MSLRRLAAATALLATAACSESTNPPPGGGNTTPAAIAIASGNSQSGTIGTQLANPLVVRVTNSDANGISGVTVNWSVTTGNGTVSSTSSTTNAQGQAQVTFTLGASPGTNGVRATVANTSLTADFTLTGTQPPDNTPATIVIVDGDAQTETVGLQLSQTLVVRVRNAGNQNLSGITVQWQVTQGGGTLGSTSSVTGAAGTASNTYTLSTTTGAKTITASVQSNPALSVDFTASGSAATASTSPSVMDNFFDPKGITVSPGATVTWTWGGNLTHNVTWVAGGFPNSANLSSGTYPQTFPSVGTYQYYCTFHGTPTSGMRGVVIVN